LAVRKQAKEYINLFKKDGQKIFELKNMKERSKKATGDDEVIEQYLFYCQRKFIICNSLGILQ
jgi:hypothetical protein